MLTFQIDGLDKLTAAVTANTVQLKRIGDTLVALKDELTALATAFDKATTAVAGEIATLKQTIADLLANPNSITEADKTAVETQMQATIDKLTAMGAGGQPPTSA